MPESGEILNEAYELIEKGDQAQARSLLEPLLQREPTNQDALWIYAHAAETPQSGRDTLLRLYTINPNYPGLQSLLTDLSISIPASSSTTAPVINPSEVDSVSEPSSFENDERPSMSVEETSTATRGGRSLLYLILAGLIVVVVVLLLLNAISGANPGQPEPTDEAQVASEATVTTDVSMEPESTESTIVETSEDVAEATIDATEATETTAVATADVSSEGGLTDVTQALADYEIAETGITSLETTLGNTLVVSICALPGPDATQKIRNVFEALAQQTDDVLNAATALGVGLTDCNTNTTLRTVGVSLDDARSYIEGALESREFESLWQPV